MRNTLLFLLVAGCVADVRASEQDIIGGTASNDAFAVAIVGRPVHCDEAPPVECTGVLIAPRVVLTAAHCVQNFSSPRELQVFFGGDVTLPGTFVMVATGAIDRAYDRVTGDHDLAVLALAEDAPIAPTILSEVAIETLAPGTTLRVIGFGTSDAHADDPGTRRSGTMTLGEVRAGSFDAAPGPQLSCRGDSGGPVLAMIAGTEQVIGITASGDTACRDRATQARIDVALTGFIQPMMAAYGALGPAWPSTAIPIGEVATHACATDADCPALMECDTGDLRCALPSLGLASYGGACTTDAACGMETCARLWPDGPDACRCAHQSIAPPPPPPMGGGCSLAWGAHGGAALVLLAMAIAARRRLLGGGIVALAVGAFVWLRAAPVEPPPTTAVSEAPLHFDAPVGDLPSADPHAPTTPPPSSAPPPPLDLTGMTIEEQAAAIGDDDLSDGLDLPAPPIQTELPPEQPTHPEADPNRVMEQREAGLHLLDTTIERLGREADQMAADGDGEGATRTRVRMERMRALRVHRAEELETLRQGGALPSADPRIPGHGPPPTHP